MSTTPAESTQEPVDDAPATAPDAAPAHEIETRASGTVDERDELTGVRGRYALLNSINFKRFKNRDVYVALCDLDNFRIINDAYGENRGNDVLARIGQALQSCFGDKNVCRYGSDEFLIINAFFDEDAFLEKIEVLDGRLAAIDVDGKPLHITCSYGYTFGKISDIDELHEAIRLADRKVYEAKRLGKARAVGSALETDPRLSGSHLHDHQYKSYEMDELTGLANLIHFRNQLETLIRSRLDGEASDADRIALVCFNVQNFKGYNEKYGFDAGDELLMLIGDSIREAFPNSLASRFSADQFMVATTAGAVEDGIAHVRGSFRRRQKTTSIWLKAGVYVVQEGDADNVGLCIDRPKIACDSIRGRRDVYYRYYDQELQSQILMNRYVLENFDRALRESWIKLFYQPIVRIATGEVCDEEVLARWVDPERGIISPAGFIPVLEEARLIHKLDLYIVRRACEIMVMTQREGQGATPVSLNLSPLDFELCDIVDEVVKIVEETGADRRLISVEVTESVLAGNQEFLKGEIDCFRDNGFEVWMDDFGSGYSSLNTLKDYNFDLVKVDMGFLRDFENNEQARILLSHIIGMSKELGLKTLVEGVETEEQCEFLRSIGCGRAQGYFFGKPTNVEEVAQAVSNGDYLPLELPDRHHFYEAVGRVNLLRPTPASPDDGHYVPGDIPAAILRRQKGVYEYLNVSSVYRSFLNAMGVANVFESEKRLNDKTRVEHIRVNESVDTCIFSGDWEWATYYENGKYCSLRVKCIATNPEEDSVAVLLVAVNVQENALIASV